ncbi:uncharacterized protein METZ01_LOCUS187120, partial [marine metagenome]
RRHRHRLRTQREGSRFLRRGQDGADLGRPQRQGYPSHQRASRPPHRHRLLARRQARRRGQQGGCHHTSPCPKSGRM